jgi:hypothetical protein
MIYLSLVKKINALILLISELFVVSELFSARFLPTEAYSYSPVPW